jgi:hypothetical protein
MLSSITIAFVVSTAGDDLRASRTALFDERARFYPEKPEVLQF